MNTGILNPCVPGSNLGHGMIFFFFCFFVDFLIYFFYVFLSLLLQCKFANSTLLSLVSFSYFITPYDAQASSAFSALIVDGFVYYYSCTVVQQPPCTVIFETSRSNRMMAAILNLLMRSGQETDI